MSPAGFTPYLAEERMERQARSMTVEGWGCLRGCRYLLQDRDTEVWRSFVNSKHPSSRQQLRELKT